MSSFFTIGITCDATIIDSDCHKVFSRTDDSMVVRSISAARAYAIAKGWTTKQKDGKQVDICPFCSWYYTRRLKMQRLLSKDFIAPTTQPKRVNEN